MRWYRTGSESSEWNVQSVTTAELARTATRGEFCKDRISDSSFENDGGSEIVIGDGMFDKDNKKMSIEWTRPFDIQISSGLTLIGNYDFDIYLTWVTAPNAEFVPSGRQRLYHYGATTEDDV